ncbi:hypothetical protein B738_11153 [Photorhabdus temperata subsp. temperata M1021]|nr:hypothetical protein B738_11153 [Photorhabdus temperata subsp. temperata M1021]
MHRGGEMLSSYEAPQLSELFAVYTVLTVVRLPPTPVFTDVAINTESIVLLLLNIKRQHDCFSPRTLR